MHNAWGSVQRGSPSNCVARYSGFKPLEFRLGGGVTVRRDFYFFSGRSKRQNEPCPFSSTSKLLRNLRETFPQAFWPTPGSLRTFQPPCKIRPRPAELPIANGDGTLRPWPGRSHPMVRFTFAHLVGAIVHVDPPLTTVRPAQIPLVNARQRLLPGSLGNSGASHQTPVAASNRRLLCSGAGRA